MKRVSNGHCALGTQMHYRWWLLCSLTNRAAPSSTGKRRDLAQHGVATPHQSQDNVVAVEQTFTRIVVHSHNTNVSRVSIQGENILVKFKCLFYGVLCCSMVFYSVLWCSMVFYGVLQCSMVFYGVLQCSMVLYGVIWCSMVFCGVIRCSMVFYGVLWCSMVF